MGFSPWLMWYISCVAIAGAILNVKKNRNCFLLWMVSNVIMIIHSARIGEWPQASVWTVYLGFAIWGWFSWGKKEVGV